MTPFLKKYDHRSTYCLHLAEFTHLISKKEKDTVKAAIAAKDNFFHCF